MENNLIIDDKYFNLEIDNRFPLEIPNHRWNNLNGEIFRYCSIYSIYLIKCNNHLYVGGDKNRRRVYDHRSDLKSDHHYNKYMQNTFNKNGIENFYFLTLCQVPEEFRQYRDQIENSYIKLFDTFHGRNPEGFNILEFAKTAKGHKHSEETKEKIRISNTGKTQSEESRLKISQSHLGQKAPEKTKQILHFFNEKRKLIFYLTNTVTLKVTRGIGIREFARNMGWPNSGSLFYLLNGKSRCGVYKGFRMSTLEEINSYLSINR
jgi:group I intron endonuclease